MPHELTQEERIKKLELEVLRRETAIRYLMMALYVHEGNYNQQGVVDMILHGKLDSQNITWEDRDYAAS